MNRNVLRLIAKSSRGSLDALLVAALLSGQVTAAGPRSQPSAGHQAAVGSLAVSQNGTPQSSSRRRWSQDSALQRYSAKQPRKTYPRVTPYLASPAKPAFFDKPNPATAPASRGLVQPAVQTRAIAPRDTEDLPSREADSVADNDSLQTTPDQATPSSVAAPDTVDPPLVDEPANDLRAMDKLPAEVGLRRTKESKPAKTKREPEMTESGREVEAADQPGVPVPASQPVPKNQSRAIDVPLAPVDLRQTKLAETERLPEKTESGGEVESGDQTGVPTPASPPALRNQTPRNQTRAIDVPLAPADLRQTELAETERLPETTESRREVEPGDQSGVPTPVSPPAPRSQTRAILETPVAAQPIEASEGPREDVSAPDEARPTDVTRDEDLGQNALRLPAELPLEAAEPQPNGELAEATCVLRLFNTLGFKAKSTDKPALVAEESRGQLAKNGATEKPTNDRMST